jgi:ABC-type spermidine/putrescine transport system permease subunit I
VRSDRSGTAAVALRVPLRDRLALRGDRVWLSLPAVALTVVFFLIPIILMGRISLTEHISGSAYVKGSWTWEGYRSFLSNRLYLKTFFYTLWVSLMASGICLALSFPLAYWMNRARARLRVILIFAVIVPLWTNLLVLLYGWLIMLSPRGVINIWLMDSGLRDTPIRAVYNTSGVLIGLVQITMPYAVLILAAVLAGQDPSLVEASRNLGASRFQGFLRVTLPLSMPGIASAATVVFVWAMGEYATPQLLGSTKNRFVSQEVSEQMLSAFNWSRAAALAISLFGLIIVVLLLAQSAARIAARRREA